MRKSSILTHKPEGLEHSHNQTNNNYLPLMGTYKQIFYQLVFGTKLREPTIREEYSGQLYSYIAGIVKKQNCKLYAINGMPDHLHIFSDLHPSVALADLIKDIKLASSQWMKGSGYFKDFTYWQDGYGAFTYSVNDKGSVIRYIENQKEHHKKENFYDELKRLLAEHQVEYDPKYFV